MVSVEKRVLSHNSQHQQNKVGYAWPSNKHLSPQFMGVKSSFGGVKLNT